MKISILIITITILANFSLLAQRTISPTDSLVVTGEIINASTFSLAALDTFSKTQIKDQIIYNQKGEIKDTVTGLSGIPVKNLLASIHYKYDKTKELNEFYFLFIASDGYKVVFSWNEIYNTDVGNHSFIVTEMEGKKNKDLDQRILFISTADLNTGRRYIKGLKKIEVRRVE
jgi:hypothetical protein